MPTKEQPTPNPNERKLPKLKGRRARQNQAQQRYSRRSAVIGLLTATGVALTAGIAVHSLTQKQREPLIAGDLEFPAADGQAITYSISPAIIKEKFPSILTPPDRNRLKDLILELQGGKVTDPKELRRDLINSLGLIQVGQNNENIGNCFGISRGFYVTAGHLLSKATPETYAKITIPGTGDRVSVTHYIKGSSDDLALLFVSDQNQARLNKISLASKAPEAGQTLFQTGLNDKSPHLHVTRGQVTTAAKTAELADKAHLPNAIAVKDMISIPGLSGSPVINETAVIIGIQSHIYKEITDPTHGGTLISPASRLLAVVENHEISPLSISNRR